MGKNKGQGLEGMVTVTDLDKMLSIKWALLVEQAYQIKSLSLIAQKLLPTLQLCAKGQTNIKTP